MRYSTAIYHEGQTYVNAKTNRPAMRKYATFHACFRLLFVVSLPGVAKGRHAKTRQNHHLAGFCVATFRVLAPKTRLYDMTQISHHNWLL